VFDWTRLSELLSLATPLPWTVRREEDEIVVIDTRGEDIFGLAPCDIAISDYEFIAEVRNTLGKLLEQHQKFYDLLIYHRVCLDCGTRMNRQLYCVKCDIEWAEE